MAGNKAFLIRKLVNLKFKEGTSITEHLNEMRSVVNQLAAMKMVLDDELQALLLLLSLLESWETMVVSFSNLAPDGVVSMSHVTSNDKENGTMGVATKGNDEVLTTYDEDCFGAICNDFEWIVDTGASYHATPNEDFFSSYNSGEFGVTDHRWGRSDLSKRSSHSRNDLRNHEKSSPNILIECLAIGSLRLKVPSSMVVAERYSRTDLPEMEKKKYLVPRDMSVGQFIHVLSSRLHLTPGKALFVFVNTTLPQTASLMDSVYESSKDEDGFLYMCYSSEKTFG
ncbi:hypothetical protein HHK36_026352 [Tetracentron sinense]|uniref:Autophagy-related protein n=1 Tax=Tetracentron sinense TaxID=13715 RepID=A0A834YJA2_TETSI|nr:hypothetical protein HHK36_026352 [Tetracentron sinense]